MIRKFLHRRLDPIAEIARKPSSVKGYIRRGLVGLWRTRGGGLYGLGYVVCFVVLEARTLVGDVVEAANATQALAGELVEWFFRFGVDSFVNVVYAFLWPGFVLNFLGAWGLVVLAIGFFGFERFARPWVEQRLPELAASKKAEV